jgi:hypothetical protein
MAVRLRNEKDPNQTLSLAYQVWFSLLDLAELYGWQPMGAILPGNWSTEVSLESYFPMSVWDWHAHGGDQAAHTVLWEDALNLADALEQAFQEYEPQRMPASFFLFEPEDLALRTKPSIGAITALIDFCRSGPFFIESHRPPLNGSQHT